MTLGDRVVVMKDGWVQQVGEPLELYNTPANKFVAGFIGSPAMNFANVKVTEANGSLLAENAGLRIKLPEETAQRLRGHAGRDVTLGIRPEDLTGGCGRWRRSHLRRRARVAARGGISRHEVGDGADVRASSRPCAEGARQLRLAMRRRACTCRRQDQAAI